MGCEPHAVTWRALLGACRIHRNEDLAIYAAKQILKLDPEDAGTYILLSNIYMPIIKGGDDVAEVRRTMKARGVKKEPGCSWIVVNKKIHAFIYFYKLFIKIKKPPMYTKCVQKVPITKRDDKN